MTETTVGTVARTNAAEFTVSELAGAIKRALEDGFGYVRLRGEISGFRGPHSSGHCYFSLKDDRAKIDAVVWRGVYGRLKIKPEEGMEVIAQGRVTTYPNSSKYQIVIETLEPAGVGALMALLEERKRKLGAEGLFDDARKQEIPFLPRVVGIVTSPTGAVIRDMMHGFNERFPARVVVWPVRVQGEGSAKEVAAAIKGFNALDGRGPVPRPDVLIVARGGGSLEDLWSFNEEIVVRAVAESSIPLIAAVGHETDWTLIDLAADARAPTPTKAAEWAVPRYADLTAQTDDLGHRLKSGARRVLEQIRSNLRAAARGLPRPGDLVALPRQRFDGVERRLTRGLVHTARSHSLALTRIAGRLRPGLLVSRMQAVRGELTLMERRSRDGYRQCLNGHATALLRTVGRLNPEMLRSKCVRSRERYVTLAAGLARDFRQQIVAKRTALDGNGKLLATLGYRSVLRRGYAVVRDRDGQAVRSAGKVVAGTLLNIELADGRVDVQAIGGADAAQSPTAESRRARAAKPGTVRAAVKVGDKSGSGQGSLF